MQRLSRTLNLFWTTQAKVWIEVGESVFRAGCRKLIIVNSHGGQPQVIDVIARVLRVRHDMFVVIAMWSRMTRKDDLFSKS